jgi:hypothetical protein
MRQIVLVALIMLLGCTHYNYPFSVDGLKEQGYQQVGSHPAYKVWAKEIQDEGRRVHLCIAPEPGSGGYVWEATVYVDGREAWTYSIGGASSQPPLLTGIDCTTSAPLPQGRVSFRTLYKFWR